jgi:hypothetical protein
MALIYWKVLALYFINIKKSFVQYSKSLIIYKF